MVALISDVEEIACEGECGGVVKASLCGCAISEAVGRSSKGGGLACGIALLDGVAFDEIKVFLWVCGDAL